MLGVKWLVLGVLETLLTPQGSVGGEALEVKKHEIGAPVSALTLNLSQTRGTSLTAPCIMNEMVFGT